MKLAFSTNAFKRYSLVDAIKEIGRIGYSGVEILCDIPHAYPPNLTEPQVNSTIEMLSECKLQISNLNAFTLYAIGDVYHPSWIEREQSDRDIRLRHTADCLRLAKRLGAASISTEPGGPITPEVDSSALLKLFVAGIKEAEKVAREEGVKLLVEPEPSLLIEKSEQFRQFIKTIGSEYVKLNFDIGHFYCVGEDPADLVSELADQIEHFHLADIASSRVHNHLIPGKGSIDFGSVFEAIENSGYTGFVTVELYPYQDDPVHAATEAYRHLSGILECRT